jgi:muconolactone delta-isomerase
MRSRCGVTHKRLLSHVPACSRYPVYIPKEKDMRYLVEISLQQTPTQEILELLPAESAHGKKFDESGAREALYVSATEVKAWQVYQAGSKDEVRRIVESFPLTRFCSVNIIELRDQA